MEEAVTLVRLALDALDDLAKLLGPAFERYEYDRVQGARDLLRSWLTEEGND